MFSGVSRQSSRARLITLFAAGLCFWTSLATLLPTIPLYVQDIGGSPGTVGLIMGAFAIGLLGSRSWLGQMADQHSRRRVLLIGVAVTAIASFSYPFIQFMPLLFCLRAFHGISVAAFGTAYNTLVVDVAPAEHRGRLLGYMTLVNPLGVALGPALGGILQSKVGYPPLFFTSTALALLSWVCVLCVNDPMLSTKPIQGSCNSLEKERLSFWTPLKQRAFFIPTLMLLLVGITFGSIAAFVPLFMRQASPDLNVGMFYTAAAIASFSIRLLVGKASDRLGRGLFITLGILCYGISMVFLFTAQNEWSFLAAGFSEGCGGGVLIPTTAALIADRSPEKTRASLFSLCMAGFDLGMAIAGPILGIMASQLGYQQLYGITGIGVGIAMLVFILTNNPTMKRSIAFAFGRANDSYAYSKAF
jgi:MFS family permease